MKITPIPEQLWGALCILSGETKDLLEHATENDFSDNVDFIRLNDAYELVTEFILCHNATGEVSQRGEVPQCWNENTIFTPHRELGVDEEKQLEFDWGILEEDTPEAEENNNG